MDWGMALSVGLGVALVSEVSILSAMILPRFPIDPGKTWRGTVMGVSFVSVIIGGVGGYIAGQFGGRGGGGALNSGSSPVSTAATPNTPQPTVPSKIQTTAPVRPASYLANKVDLYFVRDPNTKLVANFTCEIAGYRKNGSQWDLAISKVEAKNLDDFLRGNNEALARMLQDIPQEDQAERRLRIYLDPFPGDGVYERLRQLAEPAGWKVERKDVSWKPELPG
jgi:hypothetical protein